MSSAKPKYEEKYDIEYWDVFASTSGRFITARQITMYILVIAIIVQTVGYFMNPTDWLIWNALTFIVATNLGAVLLAIHAQSSADDIREMYGAAFNGDFYHTLYLLTQFKNKLNIEAAKQGHSVEDELESLSVDVYGVIKGYLQVFNEQIGTDVPENPDSPADDVNYDEEDLFTQEG